MSWQAVLEFNTNGYPVAINHVEVNSLPPVQGTAHSFLHNDGEGNWTWEVVDYSWIAGTPPPGPIGPTGPASTVPGPTGPTGPASTVPGPASTVPGPTGPASTVPGPTGPASTVPGPTGPASTVPGPTGPGGQSFTWQGTWSILTTYSLDDVVRGSDGDDYISVQDTNLANDPTTDFTHTWWDIMVIQGAQGPTGPTGPASTVPGPAGPTGPASTVPGPTGPASTVPGPTGPTGPASTVPGPASTVPGPTGPASTVPGPTGPASTVPGPTGPTGPASTVPGPTGPTGPSGSGVSSGASFPGSPSAGNQYFRTDLGWLCYYDGSRWLTAFELSWSTPLLADISSNSELYEAVIRGDYAVYVTRLSFETSVQPTNDATHYWSFLTRGRDAPLNNSTSIDTFDTHSDSAATYVAHDHAPSATATPTYHYLFGVGYTKVGTPGTLQFACTLYYRLIVT
jgi:hypothetical protein